ncbi:MAG: HDIG domain-containing protein [Bacteroidaceae bacterium]|nr:HDIG domain-containing protein [Bacteroidaceae bacterium]
MKIILVLLSTALVVYFMPKGDEFGYKYELNKPWNYGLLIANSKFPILKNDSLLRKEQLITERNFQPYYYYDMTVKESMQQKLHSTEAEAWQGDNAKEYVKHIASLLDTIYTRGVMSIDDYTQLTEEQHHKRIRIIKDNIASSVSLNNVFTLRTAYRYIMTSDTNRYSRIVLQKFNINELIQQNLRADAMKSKEELSDQLSGISSYSGFVQAGEKIIDRGETVTEDIYDKLRSYEQDFERRNTNDATIPYKAIGQSVFVFVIFVLTTIYLSLYRDDYFDNIRNAALLYTLPVLFCILASFMVSHKFFHVFMVPFCSVPIVIRVFMDSRTAFMIHCAMIMMVSITLSSGYEFVVLQLVVGMAAIHSLRALTERSQIIRTALLLFIVYSIFYTGYSLYHENGIKMDYNMYYYFGINSVLTIFTYPLLWMLEKLFGFTSDVTLIELSNVSNPLLQRMTEVAPGTFQHSMQVANLCAEVAKKIGGNAQLVRTGALYHDIGKMERPVFFTENQNGISPHKHLTALKSAQVIIAHVSNGISLAEKNHIPEAIKRFILTHHGHSKAKYFYITYRNEHPNEEINESEFTYPGPNPSSKEEAILMMCDAVEAASRSLPEYTEESINTLVDRIIDGQMTDGCYSECSITFKDIATAKAILKEKLKTIYHTRISYPELNEANKENSTTNEPSTKGNK